jgi:hypothetical protein
MSQPRFEPGNVPNITQKRYRLIKLARFYKINSVTFGEEYKL